MVRLENGAWAEALPVVVVPEADRQELAAALEAARQHCGLAKGDLTFWGRDGEGVYSHAEALWSVYWYSDGTLAIVPERHVPTRRDPVSGDVLDGGWADVREWSRPLPSGTAMSVVAETLMMRDKGAQL